jgi:hypothetical protein
LDAQELFKTLKAMTVAQNICTDSCEAGFCRPKCSLEVVDELLSTPLAVTGEEMDLLLDFRSLLRARSDAEATLRLFCELRRRLEQRHYLAFYRLRRWLENQLIAQVSSAMIDELGQVSLHLDYYCIEAVRRQCLCAAIQQETASFPARLRFSFVPLAQPQFA